MQPKDKRFIRVFLFAVTGLCLTVAFILFVIWLRRVAHQSTETVAAQPVTQVVYVQATPQVQQPAPIQYAPPPEPEPTPAPIQAPTPEPLPPFSIRQINDSVWVAVIPRGDWYDLGIPVLPSQTLFIKGHTRDDRFQVSINGDTRYSQKIIGDPMFSYNRQVSEACQGNSICMNVPPDFCGSPRVRIVPLESGIIANSTEIEITVWGNTGCYYEGNFSPGPPNQAHIVQHEAGKQRASEMRQRIAN